MADRETILSEIRRLADESGGRPPESTIVAFAKATGIGEHEWKGVLWRRLPWSAGSRVRVAATQVDPYPLAARRTFGIP